MLTFPNPSYAHLAFMLRSLNKSNQPITIFTNGPIPSIDKPTQIALADLLATGDIQTDPRPITRLINNGPGAAGITLEFATGSPTTLGMIFHRPATRSRGHALIAQLGLETKTGTPEGEVVVADPMLLQTSVRGCFVAGDTHQMMKQVVVAAADGVRAAAGVVMQLCEEEMGKGEVLVDSEG
jgi:thioredoxin reductase